MTLTDIPFLILPESVGIYDHFPGHSVTRAAGSLNNFNIHYVCRGRGYVEEEGQIHELQAGQAVLYFPLQYQRYYSDQEDPWDIRWVHFYGHGIQEYLIERGFHLHKLWMLRQRESFEQAHLALLEEAETNKMLNQAKLSALMYAVLSEFVLHAGPVTESKQAQTDNVILELLPQMQQEANKPFALEDWASRAGFSTYYFCKQFRKAIGITPMEFVTRCRLQMAKQWLLERPRANIGQIARESGYPSVSYFNKRFYEHEHVTPTDYRRLHGN